MGLSVRFEFSTARKIIFGEKTSRQLGTLARHFGERAMVVHGAKPDRLAGVLKEIASSGISLSSFPVSGEPTVEVVGEGIARAKREKSSFLIAIGGGSVIDAGKAIAALLQNDGPVVDFLEVIGKGRPLVNSPVPFIAVPTTSGTGSEVTKNAVLFSPQHQVKVSLRGSSMFPTLAVVDPELTYSLPLLETASTGLDALTQVVEPFLSSRSNPLVDSICREGMRRIGGSLLQACEKGSDEAARRDMSMGSLCGGIALSNAGLGAVHGFAAPLGGTFGAPHGVLCARLLPEVLLVNRRALRERHAKSDSAVKIDQLGILLTGEPRAGLEDAVRWIRDVIDQAGIPSLSRFGVSPSDFPTIIEKANASSSMKGNPLHLSNEEMVEILSLSL